VALFDNALLMTEYASLQQIFTGRDPVRAGNTSPHSCPSGVFYAKGRSFLINSGNTQVFHRLVSQVVNLPHLASAPAEQEPTRPPGGSVRALTGSVRAAALVALATTSAQGGNTLRCSAQYQRGNPLSRGANEES